jgi:2-C-methyl-D-erythritol 2,4-cyclodiphosphate synthase
MTKHPLFLTGLGQDQHPLLPSERGEKLYLGGVAFDCGVYFQAKSDGDVIIHALCNALSTALGGYSFSTIADPLYQQGITDSSKYLSEFIKILSHHHYHLSNIAITLEAKQPKLEPHAPTITKNLARLLQLDPQRIGLALTSGENLTSFGRGEGISCFVSVLLEHD